MSSVQGYPVIARIVRPGSSLPCARYEIGDTFLSMTEFDGGSFSEDVGFLEVRRDR